MALSLITLGPGAKPAEKSNITPSTRVNQRSDRCVGHRGAGGEHLLVLSLTALDPREKVGA